MSRSDHEALDDLVSEHLASLQRLAVRLTGSVGAAEEISQEALLRIVRSWSNFRRESSFRTWAIRILLNVFHDWLTNRREAEPLTDCLDVRQADPLECAMAEELGRYIAKRVSALPPRQREVLIFLAYEGLSPEDTARLLDMQLANVYATLYQARQRLRVELAPFLMNSADEHFVVATQQPGSLETRSDKRI